jgi:hypothetical protein
MKTMQKSGACSLILLKSKSKEKSSWKICRDLKIVAFWLDL